MSVAAYVRRLLEAGLGVEQALLAAEILEQDGGPRSLKSARNRRHYERLKASESSESDAQRASPTPPSETNPPSPPKGGSSPHLDAIWAATPAAGRQRSSRQDLARALNAARRRGHDPTAILAAIKAYYAGQDPQFAKGVHRLVHNDRWQAHAPAAGDPAEPLADRIARWGPAEWRAAVTLWRRTGGWSDACGPPPGQPGCRAPPQALLDDDEESPPT